MYPVNQVIVGGNDFLPNNIEDINNQIAKMEAYKKRLESLNDSSRTSYKSTTIWDSIDAEVNALTEEQKKKLIDDETYMSINNELQTFIQGTILNMVKPSIESSEQGKSLLNKMLETVKVKKEKIIKDSNLEMELFSKFREFSKNNPSLTYEEFLKTLN